LISKIHGVYTLDIEDLGEMVIGWKEIERKGHF
jgi:hypothetical protein